MAGQIEFTLETTAVFLDGSKRSRSGVELPYRRFCRDKVDGLPLIPRACDVPSPGMPVRLRAHKNRKGTVWCCHIVPEDLPEGGSLAGRYFHEPLVEKEIKTSDDNPAIAFCARCHMNGGPLLIVDQGAQSNGKIWYRAGHHLVWIASPNQLSDGQITLLEGDSEASENPLTMMVNGEERGVYLVLGFIEIDPQRPPLPKEVRRAYNMMLGATLENSAPVLKVLIDRSLISQAEAARIGTDTGERRYALIQAFRKAYHHSVSVYGSEKRDDHVTFDAPTIFQLAERAARRVKRTSNRKSNPKRQMRTPTQPGADISVTNVLTAVADKHFPERDGQRRDNFIQPLTEAGYHSAAAIAAANVNELVKVLRTQARAEATITAAKKLIAAKTAEVSAAPAAGDVQL